MKRSIISLLFLYFIVGQIVAQTKTLTFDDAVQQQWRKFYPEHFDGVASYGKSGFSFVEKYRFITKIESASGKQTQLASLDQINTALATFGETAISYFPFWDYSWKSDNILIFNLDNVRYRYNISEKKIISATKFPENAANVHANPKTEIIAYTLENNLFLKDSIGTETAVTNDSDKGIVNGSDYVHRQEFGIDKGIFWSPNGNFLAFYRKDETMVADYPLVDITTPIASLKNIKYPMTGAKSEEVKLGIYDLNTKKTVFTDVTDFTVERYLTSITWSPDEKFVFIGVLNREQNHLKLNQYEALTGKFIKTLFEETHPKYVEPEKPLIFLPNSNTEFLYYSERDGYNHLYKYNTDGTLVGQVTKGEWIVLDFFGFDEKVETIYIAATKDSPLEQNYYAVNLKSGNMSRLTSESGVHDVVFSKDKKTFLDSYSNTETPNKSIICDSKGKVLEALSFAENPLADYKLGKLTLGTLKADDGKTDLHYRMITPPDFDKNKKYPVMIYVYGGPHLQLIRNSWLADARLWEFYMAQLGYVVFSLDNRGSANRGAEFENIIHRQCGQTEMRDQMTGVTYLKSLTYVDSDRIGVHGWSYGGFMTISLMLNYPETFKVGVAGGPVIDWKYYEVMYGERYMDTPQENPDGYDKTSLLKHAETLKGRLLVIHGYQDPVVVPQNSIDFQRAVIEAGTDCDYFLYPESEHNVSGAQRTHLMQKVTRYFEDYLK